MLHDPTWKCPLNFAQARPKKYFCLRHCFLDFEISVLPFVVVFRRQDIQEIWLLFLPIIITAKALHFCLLEPHTSGFFPLLLFDAWTRSDWSKAQSILRSYQQIHLLLTQAYFHLNVDQSVYRCFRRDFYRKNGGGGHPCKLWNRTGLHFVRITIFEHMAN